MAPYNQSDSDNDQLWSELLQQYDLALCFCLEQLLSYLKDSSELHKNNVLYAAQDFDEVVNQLQKLMDDEDGEEAMSLYCIRPVLRIHLEAMSLGEEGAWSGMMITILLILTQADELGSDNTEMVRLYHLIRKQYSDKIQQIITVVTTSTPMGLRYIALTNRDYTILVGAMPFLFTDSDQDKQLYWSHFQMDDASLRMDDSASQ